MDFISKYYNINKQQNERTYAIYLTIYLNNNNNNTKIMNGYVIWGLGYSLMSKRIFQIKIKKANLVISIIYKLYIKNKYIV
jgi:hypothetical protein